MKNHEIRFPTSKEEQDELNKFIEKFFKGISKSKVYSIIFQEGINEIKKKLFEGKMPTISFK